MVKLALGRRRLGVAGVLLAAVAALTVVPTFGGRAVAVVSRLGGGTRLLPSPVGLSFWPLERRVVLTRQAGAAVIDAPVTVSLAQGASLPARVRLELAGSGRLPLGGEAVRARGWEAAWGEWLTPRLGVDAATAIAAVKGSDAWRQIFPASAGRATVDLTRRLAGALAPVTLRAATLSASPDQALARALGREELARAAPSTGRLVVLGLDALDWRLVDDLVGRGVMPNLGRVLSGSAQLTVRMRPPLLSPLIWTTLATGQPPEVHGVLDFMEASPGGGPPRPVSGASRKVPALWEMGAAAGRTTAVIGWWATFPAVAPPGCRIYSDRLSEQLMGLEERTAGLADPPDALAVAERLVVRGSEATPELLAPILAVTRQELASVPVGAAGWDHPIGGAARLMAATVSVQRLADYELDRGTNIVLAYLEGTDTVGHLFGQYRSPALAGADPALVRRFGEVIDRYHAFVDVWIGRVVGRLRPDDCLVVLSDHGFTWGEDRPAVASGAHTPTAVFWHRPDAVLVLKGPHVTPDASRRHLEPLDVLPTLLALAGLPPDAELPGRAAAWVRPGVGSGEASPVRYAALVTPAGQATVELPPAAREEELAKLRALGYLSGSETPGSAATGRTPERARPTAPPEPTANLGRLEARRLHNLALGQADGGDLGVAEETFRQAIAADSSYPPPHYTLARVLRLTGRFDEADRELWTAIDLGIGDPPSALARVATEYRNMGQPSRAGEVLARASERFPENATIWLDLGTLAGEQGDLTLARQCLEKAVELAPNDALARRNLAVTCLALGDREGARRAFAEALRLDPGNAEIRAQLERLGGPPG